MVGNAVKGVTHKSRRSRNLSTPRVVSLALVLCLGLFFLPSASAQSFWDQLLTGVEVTIGESVAHDVIAEYGQPIRLPDQEQERIDKVFANIVNQADRKEITYTLTILQSDVVNAFAAPGGYVFLTTGLLRHVADDTDILANVIGHEVAHIELKHGMNTITRQLGMGLLFQLVLGGSDKVLRTVVAVAAELTRLGWSREQEHQSDDVGQRLAAAAGYDPHGMVRFFEVLQALEGQELPYLEFMRTHPLTSERTERARARAASLQSAHRAQTP